MFYNYLKIYHKKLFFNRNYLFILFKTRNIEYNFNFLYINGKLIKHLLKQNLIINYLRILNNLRNR